MADGKIDSDRHRYPYCIVWTPLPLITSVCQDQATLSCSTELVLFPVGSSPLSVTWAFAPLQGSSGTLQGHTLCQRTTWHSGERERETIEGEDFILQVHDIICSPQKSDQILAAGSSKGTRLEIRIRNILEIFDFPSKSSLSSGGAAGWDSGVSKASEIYNGRMHNLFCDNCHSHVATALDSMVGNTLEILIHGQYFRMVFSLHAGIRWQKELEHGQAGIPDALQGQVRRVWGISQDMVAIPNPGDHDHHNNSCNKGHLSLPQNKNCQYL